MFWFTPPFSLSISLSLSLSLHLSISLSLYLSISLSLYEAPRRHPGGSQEAPKRLPGLPRRLPEGSQEAPRTLPGGSQGHWERVGQLCMHFYMLLFKSSFLLSLLRGVFEGPMILDAFLHATIVRASTSYPPASARAPYSTVRTPTDKSVWGIYVERGVIHIYMYVMYTIRICCNYTYIYDIHSI